MKVWQIALILEEEGLVMCGTVAEIADGYEQLKDFLENSRPFVLPLEYKGVEYMVHFTSDGVIFWVDLKNRGPGVNLVGYTGDVVRAASGAVRKLLEVNE